MNRFLLLFLFAISPVFSQTTVPEWRSQRVLPEALTGHKTVMLHTGDVLIAGGLNASGAVTNTSLLYSARTGEIIPTLNLLKTSRAHFSLVEIHTLGVSRVFAIGGYSGENGNYSTVTSIEVLEYDAAQNNWSWRNAGNLTEGRGDLAAAYDGGNFIVVSGGITQNGGALKSGTSTMTTERINISTFQVEKLGNMVTSRSEHALLKILNAQNNPQIITAGGEVLKPVTSTEILTNTAWNPQANPPITYRSSAVSFGDIVGIGRMFGGFNASGIPVNTSEWYDVKSGWRNAPRMEFARARANATLIAGVKDTTKSYLIIAGKGIANSLKETEIFSLPNNSNPNGVFTTFLPLKEFGFERTVSMTGSNLPFVAGGENEAGVLSRTELFQPLRANDLVFKAEEAGRTSDSQDVFIKNEWLLPVKVRNFRIAGSAEFILDKTSDSVNLAANGAFKVSVRFRPNGAGTRLGMLLFDIGPLTDTVMLRGTGLQSTLGIVTQNVQFDSVLVRGRKEICFPALKNNGTDTTVIDSLILSPKGQYRVISPLGRVSLAPDSVLNVCVEFSPEARGAFPAGMNIHLAARSFPVTINGFGIRKFVRANTMSDCDTVSITLGNTYPAIVTVQNPSDRTVTITDAKFSASSANILALLKPNELPIILEPGAFKNVEISFTPERENTERAEVELITDGDTVAKAQLCFIVRSRFVAYSVGEINFGNICAGENVSQTVILENPGQFENVQIDSVAIIQQNSDFLLKEPISILLKPREYTSATVQFTPTSTGQISAVLKTFGPFGSVEIPIRAKVLPNISFTPGSAIAKAGDITQIIVNISGVDATTLLKFSTLRFSYNKTMLWPRRLVNLIGQTELNESTSTVKVITPGIAEIRPQWTSTASNGNNFAIECDVLRGETDRTAITISGTSGNSYCIAESTREFTVQQLCGGRSGLVRSNEVQMLMVQFLKDSEHEVTLIAPQNGEVILELVNSLGIVVSREDKGFKNSESFTTTALLNNISNGIYFYRASVNGAPVAFEKISIIR
ncbi:MAG TPA: choice-of-anchor D domain-containing protein [Patescibacteria group bacterium]|nr:choice-of-anchor D domain-containing protein [Patescibacteria group bacterium]